jgi:hypothetical protein
MVLLGESVHASPPEAFLPPWLVGYERRRTRTELAHERKNKDAAEDALLDTKRLPRIPGAGLAFRAILRNNAY